MATTTHFRTCPLCEATCGLTITMDGDRVSNIRGDVDDVFSKGFICPKGTALKQLHEDPDRLRAPLVNGSQASWEDAFAAIEAGIMPIIEKHGPDAVAIYAGNPTVHNLAISVLLPALIKALGSKNFYSAATVDQMPKHVSCGYMFGRPELIPVPDLDRANYLLVVGANPWVSNGSLATAPDFRGRVEAISARGGKVVVVDPRRTETARGCDEHIFIRPGTDALFLMAIMNVLFADDAIEAAQDHVSGLGDVRKAVEGFTPERIADATGIASEVTRRIAHEFAASKAASVYDRVGAHQQRFGTLTSWAADVLTTITGNLDKVGGKMFPLAAHASPDPETPGGRGWATGRFTSRVKGYAEAFGQLPIAALAEEIETGGEGKVRALITIAGNPVLSSPNGKRLGEAMKSLEFMVAVDPFLNETTQHADVVLPSPPALGAHHYDFAFYGLSVRNVANYSSPVVGLGDAMSDVDIISKLALIVSRQGAAADPAIVTNMTLAYLMGKALGPGGPLANRDQGEITKALADREPLLQILDLRLRSGPYGDRFGEAPDGLTLAKLEQAPHGIDLGPLESRLPAALKTASGTVELAPPSIIADVASLKQSLTKEVPELVMIGRRHLRSNNSWMHNVPTLLKGSNRCTLLMNPLDAERLGVEEGKTAVVTSRVGTIEAPVEITDDMMPGVVSLPHGWGHGRDGTRLSVAATNPGVSVNDITDEGLLDPLSGNAALNEVPVSVSAL